MKKVLKGIGAVILAAVIFAAGYTAGHRIKTDNIISALPHMTLNKPEPTEEPVTPAPAQTAAAEAVVPEKNIIEATASTSAQDGWTLMGSAEIALANGDMGAVSLYTSAQKDKNGELMWDDSSTWLLEVESGGDYYTLINKHLQFGTVNFTAGEDENGIGSITAVVSTGTGITVDRYTYNGAVFEGQTVYNSGLMNIKGSTF